MSRAMLLASLSFVLIGLLHVSAVQAEVQTKVIAYTDGETKLEGFLAWDDDFSGKRPAVLVVHEWWGLEKHAEERAKMLAELGYVAFALDMYGEGKDTEHAEDAMAWSSQVRQNLDGWVRRANKGLEVLLSQDNVDSERVAAIGFCFGGATVMQMAYSGADLAGVVSFHGSLPVATEEQAKAVTSKVLVCHGVEDPFVPKERVTQFQDALTAADVDLQFIGYANTVHSFTNPDADSHNMQGASYNKSADERSWAHMRQFFAEIFGEK